MRILLLLLFAALASLAVCGRLKGGNGARKRNPDKIRHSKRPARNDANYMKIMKYRADKRDGQQAKRCTLSADAGPCRGMARVWFYDSSDGQCKIFMYGGCEGNQNNFPSKEFCEKTCSSNEKTIVDVVAVENDYVEKIPQIVEIPEKGTESNRCTLPADAGACRGMARVWFYDSSDGQCKRFTYGGCKGNQNKFPSKKFCKKACSSNERKIVDVVAVENDYVEKVKPQMLEVAKKVTESNRCTLPADAGPCRGMVPVWFYDYTDGQCKMFTYGGCKGNKNNFPSKQFCEKTCSSNERKIVAVATVDKDYVEKLKPQIVEVGLSETGTESKRCTLPADAGPCRRLFPVWFYDSSDGQCKMFTYGGCKGNQNNFPSKQFCENTCSSNSAVALILPVEELAPEPVELEAPAPPQALLPIEVPAPVPIIKQKTPGRLAVRQAVEILEEEDHKMDIKLAARASAKARAAGKRRKARRKRKN